MSAYTWTKSECPKCGYTSRVRGYHAPLGQADSWGACFSCRSAAMVVTAIHWGPEKYAQRRGKSKGDVDKLPLPKVSK